MVVTPHLGASTEEAQDKAGITIAEQVELALAGEFVPYAVNVAATEVSEAVRPFMALAEQLGRIFASLHDGLPDRLEIEYQGELAGAGTGILTLSVLKGLFATTTEEPVSYVNAPQLAARARARGPRDLHGHLAQLQEPGDAALGAPRGGGHPDRGRGAGRAPPGHGRRPHRRGAARRPTCWWSATTTGPG